jgi:CubicO group peptidase (beta-lactamase class C family)
MKFRWWLLIGIPLLLLVVFLATSGGDPRRSLTGMISGAAALDYLPPRREVAQVAGPPQPRLSLAEAGVDPESVDVAMRYAETRNTSALIIGVNGHLVYEKYWSGTTLASAVDLSEFTPVLAALVLGTAQQNGEIRDLDAPVSTWLTEWAQDPRGTITLRDLLTGNSNLAAPGNRTWPRSLAASYYVEENLNATLMAWPQAGKVDSLGSPPAVDADVLSLVLQRAFKSNYGKLLGERIWQPLGGGSYSIGIDGKYSSMGHDRAGCCLRASIGDWLRVGTLIANRGVFEGNQLLSPDFTRLLVTPTHNGSPRAVFLKVDGQFAARDVVRLEAAGKQRMWMVPSLKLVIMRLGDEPSKSQGWDEAMIPDNIIRGTRGWEQSHTVDGDKIDPKRYAPH